MTAEKAFLLNRIQKRIFVDQCFFHVLYLKTRAKKNFRKEFDINHSRYGKRSDWKEVRERKEERKRNMRSRGPTRHSARKEIETHAL